MTSVTVSPLAAAVSRAARHRSSLIRTDRGGVCVSRMNGHRGVKDEWAVGAGPACVVTERRYPHQPVEVLFLVDYEATGGACRCHTTRIARVNTHVNTQTTRKKQNDRNRHP